MGTNNLRIIFLLFAVFVFALSAVPYSYSKGVSEWTFYGNVTDGSSCKVLSGVVVASAYNGNASNITNSTGSYLLRLGYGSWNVTFSKAGYASVVYTTPNELAGAYQHNLYLVPTGKTQLNCTATSSSNSTVSATTIKSNSTIAAATTSIANQTVYKHPTIPNKYVLFEIGTVLFIFVVIALIAAAYFGPKLRAKLKSKNPP